MQPKVYLRLKKIFISILLVLISVIINACAGDDIPLPKIHPHMNKTIKGIDSNNNGVRDDVEVAIYKRYPTNKGMRQVAYQLAISTQKKIEVGNTNPIDPKKVVDIAKNYSFKAISCVSFHEDKTGKKINSTSLFDFINAIVKNTEQRRAAYARYLDVATKTDGAMTAYSYEKPCDYVGN